MKNDSPINKTPSDHAAEEFENEALWDLLGEAETIKASPTFAQNVLRANRLSQPESEKTSIWSFFKPALFLPAAAAVLIGGYLLMQNTAETSTTIAQTPDQGSPALSDADAGSSEETWVDNALLETALDQPDLFTDEELVAMIF